MAKRKPKALSPEKQAAKDLKAMIAQWKKDPHAAYVEMMATTGDPFAFKPEQAKADYLKSIQDHAAAQAELFKHPQPSLQQPWRCPSCGRGHDSGISSGLGGYPGSYQPGYYQPGYFSGSGLGGYGLGVPWSGSLLGATY